MKSNVLNTGYLSFIGPFRTNLNISSQELIYSGYYNYQLALCNKLNKQEESGNWHFKSNNNRSNKLSFDVDTYEGDIITPKYLLEFDYLINKEIKDDINLLVLALSEDITLEIQSITLKYMNSGSGTISFRTCYKLEKLKSADEIKLFHEIKF